MRKMLFPLNRFRLLVIFWVLLMNAGCSVQNYVTVESPAVSGMRCWDPVMPGLVRVLVLPLHENRCAWVDAEIIIMKSQLSAFVNRMSNGEFKTLGDASMYVAHTSSTNKEMVLLVMGHFLIKSQEVNVMSVDERCFGAGNNVINATVYDLSITSNGHWTATNVLGQSDLLTLENYSTGRIKVDLSHKVNGSRMIADAGDVIDCFDSLLIDGVRFVDVKITRTRKGDLHAYAKGVGYIAMFYADDAVQPEYCKDHLSMMQKMRVVYYMMPGTQTAEYVNRKWVTKRANGQLYLDCGASSTIGK